MNSSLQLLNDQQRKAVISTDGYTIIVAGPGTGKTLTFAHRLSCLLKEKNISPQNILAVTFTRSAAKEMRSRLVNLVRNSGIALDKAERLSSPNKFSEISNGVNLMSDSMGKEQFGSIWIDTFHAIALKILREQNFPFGDSGDWAIVDDEEKRTLLEGIIPAKERVEFLDELQQEKQKLIIPKNDAAKKYQKKLFEARRLDFDDLFIYACRLFEEKPEIAQFYHNRFKYILIDEFQDTSFAQYKFMKYMKCENICVIGDPDQSIYRFGNDSFVPFEQFKKDYPTHQVVTLSENYRSQFTILEAAKQVIEKNPAQLPRDLQARIAQGFPIEISSYQTDLQEAEMIARKIESLLGGASYFTIDSQWAQKEQESYSYGFQDIAIFYRFHVQARWIMRALERAGLPCRTFSKNSKKQSKQEISIAQDLGDFQNDEEGYLRGESISLMTLHRSKGLEFPAVFILGCEDGIIPYYHSQDANKRQSELEDERRLFYVGMTRAKNRLFLSYAKKRFVFGKNMDRGQSPFLRDIEEELRKFQKSEFIDKKKSFKKNQLTLFDI